MRLTTILFAFASCLLLFSCDEGITSPETSEQHEEHATEEEAMPELRLNDGAKWIANKETHLHIANMLEIVGTFDNWSDEGDVHYTARKAIAEYELLFKECTMKGPEHDQLHALLMPIFPLLDNASTTDPRSAHKDLKKVEARLSMFTYYFE